MKIFNEFGIKPTRKGAAAGYDFYIPNITVSVEEGNDILSEFSKSYNKTTTELLELIDKLVLNIVSTKGEDYVYGNELNILHLFLAITWPLEFSIDQCIDFFIDYNLAFDSNKTPGIMLYSGDHIKINSGIRVALNPSTAGLFVNKSGKGTKGWDVRACLVDEDYTGLVHLSLSYTNGCLNDTIYCGDKITQMIVINVNNDDINELSKEEYYALMNGSVRGNDGFGSSDEKH